MTTLLCRVCWNSEGWRRPTGEARRLEVQSYVSANGFGHEEWLFNREWTIRGKRYGFIQGLNTSRSRYAGQTVEIRLYTRTPSGNWANVGTIKDAYVLTPQDARTVARTIHNLGWLTAMRADLERLGISGGILEAAKPEDLVNISFPTDSFVLFDPPTPIDNQALFSQKYRRYKAYALSSPSILNSQRVAARGRRPSERLRSGEPRKRRGSPASLQDAKHDRLQNAVYALLCNECADVQYEADWIDLRATLDGKLNYFEVKAASTAKRCIREALGQLLEYAHYPDRRESCPLVVVGDAPLLREDREYVTLLNERFGLSLRYAQFDWESQRLLGIRD